MRRVVVLGGYGNFGRRLCEALITNERVQLVIAGRDLKRATAYAQQLAQDHQRDVQSQRIDLAQDPVDQIAASEPDIVVHTAGPFQGQDLRVPQACIVAGSHYVDLADDRAFVTGISALDASARAHDVLLISGASSVPALSSAIVDAHVSEFRRLERIETLIVPGNRADRGKATVAGILSYLGHPYLRLIDGEWASVFGWMDHRTVEFGDTLGRRYVANVDVPDLELFPRRYASVTDVNFQAGLELGVLHHAMVLMARLRKRRLVPTWSNFTTQVYALSRLFDRFGSSTGGMRVTLSGSSTEQKPLQVRWTLIARNGVGPFVPIIPTAICVQKLIDGGLAQRGAMPCLNLITLDEFSRAAQRWPISWSTERIHG